MSPFAEFNEGVQRAAAAYDEDPFAFGRALMLGEVHSLRQRGYLTREDYLAEVRHVYAITPTDAPAESEAGSREGAA